MSRPIAPLFPPPSSGAAAHSRVEGASRHALPHATDFVVHHRRRRGRPRTPCSGGRCAMVDSFVRPNGPFVRAVKRTTSLPLRLHSHGYCLLLSGNGSCPHRRHLYRPAAPEDASKRRRWGWEEAKGGKRGKTHSRTAVDCQTVECLPEEAPQPKHQETKKKRAWEGERKPPGSDGVTCRPDVRERTSVVVVVVGHHPMGWDSPEDSHSWRSRVFGVRVLLFFFFFFVGSLRRFPSSKWIW